MDFNELKANLGSMDRTAWVSAWMANEDRKHYSTKTASVYLQCVLDIPKRRATEMLTTVLPTYQKPVTFQGSTPDGSKTAGVSVVATYYAAETIAQLLWDSSHAKMLSL